MAKAKTSKPAVTNKASLTGAPPVRPVKETLTKTALINLVAEQNDLPRKTAASVYATLEGVFRLSTSARCWRVHLARTLEGVSSQSACSKGRNSNSQSRYRRDDQGSGETGQRPSKYSRLIQAQNSSCLPIIAALRIVAEGQRAKLNQNGGQSA